MKKKGDSLPGNTGPREKTTPRGGDRASAKVSEGEENLLKGRKEGKKKTHVTVNGPRKKGKRKTEEERGKTTSPESAGRVPDELFEKRNEPN